MYVLLILLCFGMLAYCYYKAVLLKRCLPVASWEVVTVARSVALGLSEEKHVIKVCYTFVFTQRCNMSAVKRVVTLWWRWKQHFL